jgi:thymidylate synthase
MKVYQMHLNDNEKLILPIIFKFHSLIQPWAFRTPNENEYIHEDNVELLNVQIGNLDPNFPSLNFFDVRKTSKKYVDAEIDWYNSQDLSIDKISNYARLWKNVANNEGKVNSNYGNLIFSSENHEQYNHVVNELSINPKSRRAVMIYNRPSIWGEYNWNGMNDFICTMYVHYFIRKVKPEWREGNELIAIVNMRSNDFIYGFFNDFYWQCYVLNKLESSLRENGLKFAEKQIIWNANSMHVYKKHYNIIKDIIMAAKIRERTL